MRRVVVSEWLDTLPAADPRAIASRRDLRRLNWLMGNASILARAVRVAGSPRRLVDLGAGDGTLTLALARRLAPLWPGLAVDLVDRTPCVAAATLAAIERAGWRPNVVAADAVAWLRESMPGADHIVANLFLHHFDGDALASLLEAIAARAAYFAACEPRRVALPLALSRLVGLIGCNEVTRHDAAASVRAGFAGHEISAVWPKGGWALTERAAGWSSHLFVAGRSGGA